MEQHRSFAFERDAQQCTIPFVITPRNQEALSICGPIDGPQAVPSLYDQITRFTSGGGAESNRSLVRSNSDDGSLRTIGGQAPIAFGIDLRGERSFPTPHVEPERFRRISLCDAVQADRRWQARTLHVPDDDVL